MKTPIRFGIAITIMLFTLMLTMNAQAALLFVDDFNGPLASMNGINGWESHYCDDQWQRGNGFATSTTDDGCGNGGNCCDYAVFFEDDGGICGNSEPTDNFVTVGSESWGNYEYQIDYHHDDDDSIGAVFRYTNTANYYMFVMSNSIINGADGCSDEVNGEARLYKMISGPTGAAVATELASSPYAYNVGEPGSFKIRAEGNTLSVELDTNNDGIYGELFSVSDGNDPHMAGSIGLYSYESGLTNCDDNCGFTYVSLNSIEEGEEGGQEEGGEGGQEEGGEGNEGPCAANDHCGQDAPLFTGGFGGGACYCNNACIMFGDCCDDACDTCGFCDEEGGGEEGGEGPAEEGGEEGGEEGSCAGNCGDEVNPPGPNNTCFCDDVCVQMGDCCFDACEECGYCEGEGGEGPAEEGGEEGGKEDTDGDGKTDDVDNCIFIANTNQEDKDDDGFGDACDNCPEDFNPGQFDVCSGEEGGEGPTEEGGEEGPAEEGGEEGPAEEGGEEGPAEEGGEEGPAEEGGEEGPAEEGGEEGPAEEGGEEGPAEEGGEEGPAEEGGETAEEGGETAEEEGGETAEEEGGETAEEGGETAEEEGGETAEEEGGETAEEEGGETAEEEGGETAEEEGGESNDKTATPDEGGGVDADGDGWDDTAVDVGGPNGVAIAAGGGTQGGCQSGDANAAPAGLALFTLLLLARNRQRNLFSNQ